MSSKPYTKIAIAGATGNLGPTLVQTLISAGFDLTILSRSGRAPEGTPSSVKIVTVDYTSVESLTSALSGNDAVISVLPDHKAQKPLIDAAIAAGVKRILPSEYGGDVYGNPKTAALPVFAGKKEIQEYLKSKGDAISWTLVVTGAFLDWGLETGFVLKVNPGPVMMYPQGGPTKIYDGGVRKSSVTLLSDIGKTVVGVLRHPEETKNRAVYVQSASVSQGQLLDIVKKVKPELELELEVQDVDVEETRQGAFGLLEKGEIMPAMIGFLMASTWGEGYDGTWEKNDNALLGVEELDEAGLEEAVRQYV